MTAEKPAKKPAKQPDRSVPHYLDKFGHRHELTEADAAALAKPKATLPALPPDAKQQQQSATPSE
ncbi:MAG: hypothetical protein K0S49_15 [Microbacterium sp.]|jgi:hypothetical protein|nr:hypothetical protein [Microbacterium sp.]